MSTLAPSRGGAIPAAAALHIPDPELSSMDHETVEALKRRLHGSSYLALRNIECAAHDGVVTVQGRLPTYYLKQLVQQIVTEIAGDRATRNQIEVTSRAYPATSGRDGRAQAAREGYRSEVSDPWN